MLTYLQNNQRKCYFPSCFTDEKEAARMRTETSSEAQSKIFLLSCPARPPVFPWPHSRTPAALSSPKQGARGSSENQAPCLEVLIILKWDDQPDCNMAQGSTGKEKLDGAKKSQVLFLSLFILVPTVGQGLCCCLAPHVHIVREALSAGKVNNVPKVGFQWKGPV